MELKVNMNGKKWKYNFVSSQEEDTKWMDIKVPTEKWLKLTKNIKGIIAGIANKKTNDCDFDDVLQESYLAFVEMEKESEEKEFAESEYIVKFVNKIRMKVRKYNILNRSCESKKTYDEMNLTFEKIVTRIKFAEEDKKEREEQFELENLYLSLLQEKLKESEFELLINHFRFGKGQSLLLNNKKSQTYHTQVSRMLTKCKKIIKEYMEVQTDD